MALEHIEKIKCKDCSCEFDVTVYESVNGAFDDEAQKKLLSGELFTHTCPECGCVVALSYPMLYHDMDKKFMIHLCPDGENVDECIKNIKEAQKKIDKQFPEKRMEKPYKMRIVSNENSMREKITIFENGLDDRIIELLKLFFASRLQATNKDAAISDILFFVGYRGEYAFQIMLANGENLVSEVPKHFYTLFTEQYMAKCELASRDNFIIDADFAILVLNGK